MKNNSRKTSKTTGRGPRALIALPVLTVVLIFFLASLYSVESEADFISPGAEDQSMVGKEFRESDFLLVVSSENSAGKDINVKNSQQDLSEINRFESGAFENPDNCIRCHRNIYEQWSRSKHQYAWVDEFYQPDYLKASRETEGFTDVFCGECHAPAAVRTGQLPPPDGSLFDDTSMRGIFCDYCHTVKEIVEPLNVMTVSDPGRVKRGPRADGRAPHGVEYSKIHTDSIFCGACHNVRHPLSGAVIIDTYDDWKEGPYADKGIRCQDCHMTPGPGVEKNPGKSSPMGQEREHVATHYFHGGSVFFQQRAGNEKEAELARQLLEAAAELELEYTADESGIEILARVKNVGAGHKIPTGVTYIRKMWLEVTVVDDSGRTVFESGHLVEGNHVHPETVFYRKVFRDAQGNLTPKSWLAQEIAYDRRIPAKGADEQVFKILRDRLDNGKHHATVRLMYRSMSQDLADNLGIEGLEVPGIEMANALLTFDY
jgi:hypothetical protein